MIKLLYRWIGSALAGFVGAALLVVTHSVYPPVGIFITLIGFGAYSLEVRRRLSQRRTYLPYVVVVFLVIFTATTSQGAQVLVQANLAGYLLILAGPLLSLLPLLKRVSDN